MPKIQRVANHLRYIRSNITVVIISFTFTIGAVLAAQSFVRAGSVLANDYGYDDQAYVDDNRYGCHDDGRYNCSPRPTYTPYPTHPPKPTYSPHPTYTPKPTYTPQPTHHPEPNFICTWMKATISGKTVTLYAQGNVSGGAHIVGYKFDFGDGYVSGSSGPLAHTYSRYATYNTKAWIQYKYYGQLYWTAPCTLIVNVLGSDPHPTYKPHPTYQPKPTYKPHPTYKPQPTHHPHPTYKPHPTQYPDNPTPEPSDEPEPSESPAPVPGSGGGGDNNNTNINNNNSSATANVYLTKGDSAKVVPAGYSGSSGQSYADTGMPTELPKTGSDDAIIGYAGLGSLVVAGAAYAMSRRELTDAFLNRN